MKLCMLCVYVSMCVCVCVCVFVCLVLSHNFNVKFMHRGNTNVKIFFKNIIIYCKIKTSFFKAALL